MRVYALARIRRETSDALIAVLRADGEWVTSHLSVVPAPVLRRYLPSPSASEFTPALPDRPVRGRRRNVAPPIQPAWPQRLPRPRRSPGPRRISMQPPTSSDEYSDPISDLRYEPELTTRDVADLLRVTRATVRQWVARGYLSPTRQEGPSNAFNTNEVFDAYDRIASRRKAAAQRLRSEGYFAESNAADHIRPKHYDAIITISEAARLVQVSPATIRSWMHRGYLTPASSSKPQAVRLRLEDVTKAARARRLPQVVPAWRRRNHTQ